MPEQSAVDAAIDQCAREPIQFLGGVQDFGCMLVLANDWIVQNASANCGAFLGIAAETLVGTRLTDHLPHESTHLLRGKAQILGRGDDAVPLFAVDLFGDGRLYDISMHRCDGKFLFDIERSPERRSAPDASFTGALLSRVQRAGDTQAMCDIAANGIWALTGFDRVMIYRFDPDYSGVVVAEALGAGTGSYLGHRFPASDIPPQARALYTRSLQRIIADVDAPVHPLVPPQDVAGKPVDLSLSVIRAVSPIHLQYLRNMGVAASMSISILREGRLWGMVACHNARPHYVDYETRVSVEMFCRLLAYELALAEGAAEAAQAARAYELHERMAMLRGAGADPQRDVADLLRAVGEVVALDGIALIGEGTYRTTGLAPTEAEFRAILRCLDRTSEGQVFATDHLGGACPGAVSDDRGIGGFLAIPIRRQPAEYVLLLRREVTRHVAWAGPPQKQVLPDGRLSPRLSFDTWTENVRGHCEAWSAGDLRAAEVLRVALLEMVLHQTVDSSSRDQRRSARQEVLIAELNHRLRNIFGLVAGLVRQDADSASGAEVAGFAARLSARIEALARANEMLTQGAAGAPVTLRRLLRDEARAFAGGTAPLRFRGGDAELHPGARVSMALVLHELVTNAVKYGALSVSGGEVEVEIAAMPGGGVVLDWAERGGPAVIPPSRRGFGSTLLTQAIPHELGGQAEVDFAPSGVRARFVLPGRHVGRFIAAAAIPSDEESAPAQAVPAAPVRRAALGGRAMVVEDNLLIAMNAADALRALGAEDVAVVGTIDSALQRIEQGDLDLAILDVDLGGMLSDPVAKALRAAGVPFVLATGYDAGGEDEPAAFRGVPRIRKPYSDDSIAAVLGGAGLLPG